MKARKLAVITGADGGMGQEITRAVAMAGYRVIMACLRVEKGEEVREALLRERGDLQVEVRSIDLASFVSVSVFADTLVAEGGQVSLLMNNAGTMETAFHCTEDGYERTVQVNYMGHYLLTRKLLPLMGEGSRIVNMVSCTYAIGRLDFPDFFTKGRKGVFWRIPIYSNTKLALTLFTLKLADELCERGITVNAADPGIVSTDMITMHMWFDPLTDIFFRPFIRTPRQGADTAIRLLLDKEWAGTSGRLFVSGHPKTLSAKYTPHVQQDELWKRTEQIVQSWLGN